MIVDIEALIDKLTLDELVAQMIMVSLPGTELTPEITEFYRKFPFGGAILFKRNFQNPEQIRKFLSDLQHMAQSEGPGIPMLLAVDQEGGIVAPLWFGASAHPGNMALGALRNSEYAYEAASLQAQELNYLGFNVNFAPVLDINNNAFNPVIGARSYGEQAELVASMAPKAVKGYQEHGVAACAKHFPGHGDTNMDSHVDFPIISHNLDHMEEVEFKPFQAAVKAGVEMVMIAHNSYPGIDRDGFPASLSPRIITYFLRGEMNYKGLVVTDSLEMSAVKKFFPVDEAGVRSLKAGSDILLCCGPWDDALKARQAVVQSINNKEYKENRMKETWVRVLKQKYRRPEPIITRPKDGEAFMRKVARDSITLVRNENQLLPLKPATGWIFVFHPYMREEVPVTVGGFLKDKGFKVMEVEYKEELPDLPWKKLEEAIKRCSATVILTQHRGALSSKVTEWIKKIKSYSSATVLVALSNPYHLMQFRNVQGYMTSYGFRDYNLEAVAEALSGELNPSGRLPVTIADLYKFGHSLHY